MKKVQVFHMTRYGQTALIAKRVADVLRETGLAVEEFELTRQNWQDLQPASDAGLVLGAPIYRGSLPRPFTAFVSRHRGLLKGPYDAFFCVCMAAATRDAASVSQVESYFHKLSDDTHWIPTRRAAFGGSVKYREYNFLIRYIMKRTMHGQGLSTDTSRDHEYTDWQAVSKFAREYAASLELRSVGGDGLQAAS
jgi:menaquinone-dependent protoporphyrinogen oxidase